MELQNVKTRLLDTSKRSLQTSFNCLLWPFRYMNSLTGSFIEWGVIQAKTTAQKLLLTTVMLLIILWVSVFSYASFYNLYIPSAEISKPIYLGFRFKEFWTMNMNNVCAEGSGVCSFPSANVSFGRSSQFEEVLSSGQKYRVVVELEMPDSAENRELGMFMVVMRMYDRRYYVSAESRRSVVPKYRSFPFRALDMFIWSPLYFLGFYEEKQVMSVELFSSFVDDYYHPSIGATIEIHSHKIQYYSAQVKLFANFTGLKYILHNWPVTSAFFGIWWNMCLCLLYVGVTIYKKKTTFELLSQSLNLASEENYVDSDVGDGLSFTSEDAETSETHPEAITQGTQTKQNEGDDPETYDIPLVQEPADFVQDGDLDLMAELRHRRVH